jgi:hypothetical protein
MKLKQITTLPHASRSLYSAANLAVLFDMLR